MAHMDAARWRQVSSLLDELLDADQTQRAERLAAIRRDNAALADSVAALLEQQAEVETANFLEGTALDLSALASLTGKVVGSYTLERPIGEGGMGSVWLAHRSDGRFEGKAAVKFLNLSLLARGGAQRFQREGSLLARLAHPNIARLLDAGVADGGQPFLVLEYVDGEPIDRWCDARALDVKGRLHLFLDVLAAVAHAHNNLILHRDLKPSNILVTQDGSVKLLDFGIAKLIADEAHPAQETALTRLGGQAFTPDYAAPEQVLGGEMTTAVDVYSLGVILFELLSGTRPYKLKRASAAALEEAITEHEPPLASTVAVQPAAQHQLQGDLDAILNRALKKRPQERYATATELIEDIRRHLDGLPVHAQPDRFGYRAGKFLLRNRLPVAAAAVVLLAVLGGAGVAIWQAREAARERDRALALSARNEAVIDFVNNMLTEVAPADQAIRVADLLERSESMLMSGEGNPEHQAAVLGLMSNYFLVAGNPAKARPMLDRALSLTRSSADTALRGNLLCESAYAASLLGQHADAEKAVEQGVRLSGDDALAAARCAQKRAYMAQNANDPEGALQHALRALALLRKSPVAKPIEEAALLGDIAQAHSLSGRIAEADRHFAASLERFAALGRPESPITIAIRNNWAIASYAAGDYRRALQQMDEARGIAAQRSIGGEVPTYLLSNRAQTLALLARYPEALAAFDTAIESARRNRHTGLLVNSLALRAGTYVAMGDLVRAEQGLAQAVAEAGTAITPDSPEALSIRYVRARIDAARGRLSEALAGISAVIDFFDSRQITISSGARALHTRVDIYLRQGNASAALADANRALEISKTLQGGKPHSALTGSALLVLARVHETRGAHAQARAAAAEAVPHLAEILGDEHPETKQARRRSA